MKNYLPDIIAALLVLLFVYSAMSKLMIYSTFQGQIKVSPLLSWFSSMAWILPVFEWLIVALLLFKATRLAGFYASTFLLLVFTIYITGMLTFSSHLPCSCGGVIAHLTWKQHLLFNIFFIGISYQGIKSFSQNKKISALKRQSDQLPQGVS